MCAKVLFWAVLLILAASASSLIAASAGDSGDGEHVAAVLPKGTLSER